MACSRTRNRWLNDATRRFDGERFEGLSTAWLSGRASDDAIRREFTQGSATKQVHFATCLVNTSRPSHRSAQRRLKTASAPHFRPGDCSLQQGAEGNSAGRKELTREEETRRDAAKFG